MMELDGNSLPFNSQQETTEFVSLSRLSRGLEPVAASSSPVLYLVW